MLSLCLGAIGVAAAPTPLWTPFEASFTSAQPVAPSPWLSVELNCTFKAAAGGEELTVPGFWDGGAVWRCRFAPTVAGAWSYATRCSDAADAGLHGRGGALVAVAPAANATTTTTTAFQRHGFLVTGAPGSRFLAHADGTPFYWLGDTHWSGFSSAERWSDSNNHSVPLFGPHTDSMFQQMVDTRVAQGYTAWKAETFAVNAAEGGNAPVNEGGAAWVGGAAGFLAALNPGFWQAIDRRAAYVTQQGGLLLSLAFAGIGRGLTDVAAQEAPLRALARYAVARYGALPVVWTTCQEYCTGTAEVSAAWGRIAAVQFALDAYRRPTTLHNCASNPIPPFRGDPWYGLATLQQGHHRLDGVEHWLAQYDAAPAVPILEDEANYEGLGPPYGASAVPGWMTRQSAWQAQVGGAFGFTYGGAGVWWACWNDTDANGNCGKVGTDYHKSWFEGMELEVGAAQMGHMARFWRALRWWRLAPDGAAIAWHNRSALGTQRPYQKTSRGELDTYDAIVAYLPAASGTPSSCRRCGGGGGGAGAYNGTVRGLLPGGAYSAVWFDPRSGASTPIGAAAAAAAAAAAGAGAGAAAATAAAAAAAAAAPGNFRASAQGEWELPPQPDAGLDWVALVARDGGSAPAPSPAPSVAALLAHEPATTATAAALLATAAEAAADAVPFVTAVNASAGKARIDAATCGCNLTVAASGVGSGGGGGGLQVHALGVYRPTAAPPEEHSVVQVVLLDALTFEQVAAVPVDLCQGAVDASGFVRAALPAPVVLRAGASYLLVAHNDGCNAWLDDERVGLQASSAVRSFSSVYGSGSNWRPGGGGDGACYGPANFYFTALEE